MTLNTVIIAVLVLIVLAILIFIAYKFIWGTGSGIGDLAACEARTNDAGDTGNCVSKGNCTDGHAFYKMGGCPKEKGGSDSYCCVPKDKN